MAKGAGVTRLTVYNLFGARSALFEAVFDERARRGGLHRIAEAMILDDPRASIAALVAIFNEFWASDRATLGNLYALGSSDAEFAAVLRARNERRRQAFTVLAKRLAAAGQIEPQAIDDLADVLFALTAYAFFEDLLRGAAPRWPRLKSFARRPTMRSLARRCRAAVRTESGRANRYGRYVPKLQR